MFLQFLIGRGWDRTSACKGAAGSRYQPLSVHRRSHPSNSRIHMNPRPPARQITKHFQETNNVFFLCTQQQIKLLILRLFLAARNPVKPFGDCTEREYSLKTRGCISSFVRALQNQPKKHCRLANLETLLLKKKNRRPAGCCTPGTKCELCGGFHDLVQGYSCKKL